MTRSGLSHGDGTEVLGAAAWPSNGHVIRDAARLGFIREDDAVLDLTYGRGLWWTLVKPPRFLANDVRAGQGNVANSDHNGEPVYSMDYRHIDVEGWGRAFDVVAYDPPYVAMGGRETSTLDGGEFMDRYGLDDAPKSPAELQAQNNLGLVNALRLVRPKGFVLYKCMNYTSSGKTFMATFELRDLQKALSAAYADTGEGPTFEVETYFAHVLHVRPQPPGRRQVKPRRNESYLFVLRRTR